MRKTTIIIPVPKPGKVLSDPGSYRHIALTSCLCKTMEWMVTSRLTWYLERHKVITEYQSGVRSCRYNLVTLETSIRDAFVEWMVTSRLTSYLERHKVITEYQSGVRRRRYTVDNPHLDPQLYLNGTHIPIIIYYRFIVCFPIVLDFLFITFTLILHFFLSWTSSLSISSSAISASTLSW